MTASKANDQPSTERIAYIAQACDEWARERSMFKLSVGEKHILEDAARIIRDQTAALRAVMAFYPNAAQLMDGFMANSPGDQWTDFDKGVRQELIEVGKKVLAALGEAA